MLSFVTFVFFFHFLRAHRDLHSFPTRRSSDLVGEQKVGPAVVVVIEHGHTESLRSGVAETGFLRLVFKRAVAAVDRKSTRLNSSHRCISYAVFCLKKKKKTKLKQKNVYNIDHL